MITCSPLESTRKRHPVLSLHRVANDDERIGAHLAVGNDVVRLVQIPLVDILGGHEIVDFDCMRALELYCVQLFLVDLDILSFREFVAPALVILVDDSTSLLVEHLLPQPVARLGVDLVEMRSFRLGRSGIERDRARNQREL